MFSAKNKKNFFCDVGRAQALSCVTQTTHGAFTWAARLESPVRS